MPNKDEILIPREKCNKMFEEIARLNEEIERLKRKLNDSKYR